MTRFIAIKGGYRLNAKSGKLEKISTARDVSARLRERHSKKIRVRRPT